MSSVPPAKRNLLLLFALSVVLAFAFQGSRGLYGPDEGRYAEAAREMFVSGDWLVPTLGGEPHFSKPPLAYWSIAAGLAALGVNEWGARLYLALAFIATVMIVARLGAALWDERTGWWCGFIYMTMALPFAASQIVTTDALLTLWEALAMFCFWRGLMTSRSRAARWAWVAGGWAALGAAFLTKGPPGMFPLLIMVLFIAIQGGWPRGRLFAGLFNPLGLLAFALIAAPWFLKVIERFPELKDYFLGYEVRDRIFTGEHGRNSKWYEPFKMYLPTMLAGPLPWTFVWFAALWRWWRARGGIIVEDRPALRDDEPRLLLWLWIGAPLIIFSLAQSRMILYLLPLMPAVALATGRLWMRMTGLERREDGALMGAPWMKWAAIGLVVFLFCGKGIAAVVKNERDLRPDWLAIKDDIERHDAILYVEPHEMGVGFYYNGPVRIFVEDIEDEPNLIRAEEFDFAALRDNPGDRVLAFLLDDDEGKDFLKELRQYAIPSQSREVGEKEMVFVLCNLPEGE